MLEKEYSSFNLETFLESGEPYDIEKEIIREVVVADLKEVYSRAYLVPNLVTEEEYNSIPASTYRADAAKNAQVVALLMHQVVGSNIYF